MSQGLDSPYLILDTCLKH